MLSSLFGKHAVTQKALSWANVSVANLSLKCSNLFLLLYSFCQMSGSLDRENLVSSLLVQENTTMYAMAGGPTLKKLIGLNDSPRRR